MTTNNSNIQEINSGTPPVSPLQILKTYFGYDSFREGQGEIIDTILSGRDALAIMPTGAGKSLCYQVPALLLPGITLVVSPLISLMQDQVKSLNEAGIHAAYINSSLTEGQINKALSFAARGGNSFISKLRTPYSYLHGNCRRGPLYLPMGTGFPSKLLKNHRFCGTAAWQSDHQCLHCHRNRSGKK